jgi:anaerobic glycerol-3-phosphate dehydrogenase
MLFGTCSEPDSRVTSIKLCRKLDLLHNEWLLQILATRNRLKSHSRASVRFFLGRCSLLAHLPSGDHEEFQKALIRRRDIKTYSQTGKQWNWKCACWIQRGSSLKSVGQSVNAQHAQVQGREDEAMQRISAFAIFRFFFLFGVSAAYFMFFA